MDKKEESGRQHTGCCKNHNENCGGCCGKTTIPNFTPEKAAFLELLSCAPFLPQKTVDEGCRQHGFIFDIAAMEFGSLALTGFGQGVLDIVEKPL